MDTAKRRVSFRPCPFLLKGALLGVAVLLLVLSLLPLTVVKAESPAVNVGIPVEESPWLFLPRSMPTHGEGKLAVFLIDFPDYPNDNPYATQAYYDGLYFSGGISTPWGDTTVSQYFREQSYGKLNISGQVFDWYTAQHERSYYDDRKEELVTEAAAFYLAQGVDFSQFDADGDGVLDGVIFHFAGGDADAWQSGIEYEGGGAALGQVGDLRFTTLVQVYENASPSGNDLIYIICHELMHTLGIPDLYSQAYFALHPVNDLMASESRRGDINPYTRLLLGWIDTVRVITEDTQDIRLEPCHDSGDVAIVTKSYNGLFDEFFVVAYQTFQDNTSAVIWHVDARMNSSGTGFLYQNLNYNPRPDKDTVHGGTGHISEYPFIEELSGDPDFDYVLNLPVSPEQTAFTQDSVLGPNSLPSSDTHDGTYTGIRIQNFTQHDTYLTFDVSFVRDNAAPIALTTADMLEFHRTITIRFNEHIYSGAAFENIQVLDRNGAPIEHTVLLPNYPRNTLEITFEDNAYLTGYTLILPENCLQDSSGNALKAAAMTAVAEQYLFPKEETQLPGVGEYQRNNSLAYCFYEEESFVVITELWDGNVWGDKLEFMRLDYDGNVLTQVIVDNPLDSVFIRNIHPMRDGSFLILYYDLNTMLCNQMLCLDAQGQIRWSSNTLYLEGNDLVAGCAAIHEDGLIVKLAIRDTLEFRTVLVLSQSGQIQDFPVDSETDFFGFGMLDLGNGKLLRYSYRYIEDKFHSFFDLLDTQTFQVLTSREYVVSADYGYVPTHGRANADGTFTLYCRAGTQMEAMRLDAELNILKSIPMREVTGSLSGFCFFPDGGFCEVNPRSDGNHENILFHVRGYDSNLELIWETDIEANFLHFFRSSRGKIMAYRSAWAPQRECYIVDFGSEKALVPHEHHYVGGFCDFCGEKDPNRVAVGDANGDGTVNYLDAMLIAQYYVGDIPEDALHLSASDVNKDGTVNYLDAMMVAQYYVGDIDAFPAGK